MDGWEGARKYRLLLHTICNRAFGSITEGPGIQSASFISATRSYSTNEDRLL
jgi:hypothetical protein